MRYSIINRDHVPGVLRKTERKSDPLFQTPYVCVGQLREGDVFSVDAILWWRVWDVQAHGCGDISISAASCGKVSPERGALYATERYDITHKVLRQKPAQQVLRQESV